MYDVRESCDEDHGMGEVNGDAPQHYVDIQADYAYVKDLENRVYWNEYAASRE